MVKTVVAIHTSHIRAYENVKEREDMGEGDVTFFFAAAGWKRQAMKYAPKQNAFEIA